MIKLIEKLTANKIYLSLKEGEELSISFKDEKISKEIIQELRNNKEKLITYLKKYKLQTSFNSIKKTLPLESYSISDAQRRIWILSQFEEASIAYHMPFHLEIYGAFDFDKVKKSIVSLIERHEILRTVFRENSEGEVRQWVLERESLNFEVKELDFSQDKDCEERIREYFVCDNMLAFDLEQGPLLRASIIKMPSRRYVFYYNMHHIISDGWSMEVLVKDFMAYYESYVSGSQITLPELQIQYKDYTDWQLKELSSASSAVHRAYWLDNLSGELPFLNFPSQELRPKIKTYKGRRLRSYLGSSQTDDLKRFSQESGGSLFMGLLGVWKVLCYRYTGQEDIIIGSPVAGRDHPDLEDQLGCYVNTLALRNRVNPKEDFNTFFERLKNGTLNAYSHQVYPFDRLVAELDLHRDTSRSAVFDVMLTLHNLRKDNRSKLISEEETNKIYDIGSEVSKFDMSIEFQEDEEYLSFMITYNSDVYNQKMVEGLMRHYKQLLSALLSNPTEKLGKVQYLSKEEQTELLYTFNTTKVDYPKDKTIVDLFEDQVEKTPDAIAVVFEEIELTYKELNEKSNQLAHYLKCNYSIQLGDLIGIQLGRSEWYIISILGILKAGGSYMPIDPNYPVERITYIKKDSDCKVCIDENELFEFKSNSKFHLKTDNLPSLHKSNSLVYVMYTSGTTGKPKGVMITNSNLVSFFVNLDTVFFLSEVNKFALTTNFTFDISVLETLGGLCKGKELYLFSEEVLLDPIIFMDCITRFSIEGVQLTPSRLSQLYDLGFNFPSSISVMLVGGEAMSLTLYERLKEECFTAINVYGPTETTIWSSSLVLKDSVGLSIGSALQNEQIYILSFSGTLQPLGVEGDIYIGGAGVALGYLNRSELTKDKFVSNPFMEGEQLYKTGDLGRRLSDGTIEFIGRNDDQVKIRGHRIELGEIEHVLSKKDQLNEVVVLSRNNVLKEKELVVYFTSNSAQTATMLRSYLQEYLPDYMLPSHYVQLKEFPLTSSGKIDRHLLLKREKEGLNSGVEYVAPRNELEAKVVKIWEQVLGKNQVGINDNFFTLGGNSLKAGVVRSKIQKEFDVKVELKELYINSTIVDLTSYIESLDLLISQMDQNIEGTDELVF
tara:strand:+ start:445 stop:3795 length:3351 start_codon:yes stop_codon:yes gene_type:complete